MNAMVLAAGLGTRLRPWTLEHPKALVPVEGVPMLERVILRLREAGFDRLVVNVHHFGEQIIDFLASHQFGVQIEVSDERDRLLDTGGGLRRALGLVPAGEPLLVHNVDILSDAPLDALMAAAAGDATLLVSRRESSRKLLFERRDGGLHLCGWHNLADGAFRWKRPEYVERYAAMGGEFEEYAFSGIYVVGGNARGQLTGWPEVFPVMDWLLSPESAVTGFLCDDLRLIDIGKPASLASAAAFLHHLSP